MNLRDLDLLLGPQGEAALAAAARLLGEGVPPHTALERLRRSYGPPLARAAMEQAVLRRRARAKFSFADQLLLTRRGLEQASAEAVARHRARRFVGRPLIFDLCCGIGGDALALASQAPTLGLDLDPVHAALCAANARRLGLGGRLQTAVADVRDLPLRPPQEAALFFDPARRAEGRRIHSPQHYRPPLSLLQRWLPKLGALCAKVSPGVDWDELRPFDCEVEFVSLDGQLREACLWFGEFKGPRRRATLLPQGETLAGDEGPQVPIADVGEYLYLPDAAVMRARLVRNLAARIDAWMLDAELAFLSSDRALGTPFARRFKVREAFPFGLKTLRKALRARGVGRITLMARGMGVEVPSFLQRLRLEGDKEATLILTRLKGRPMALLVDEEGDG